MDTPEPLTIAAVPEFMSPSSIASPRTIVLIVNQAWVAWKFRSRLMAHLRDEGWTVVLIADTRERASLLEGLCDEVVHVPVAASRIDPLADLRTAIGYWRALRRLRPAAVLSFTIKPNIYGSMASHMLGIPVINNVTGLGSVKRSGRWVSTVVQLLYRRAFSRAAWVFFQNPDDARELTDLSLVQAARSSLLPGSGVDTDTFAPRPALAAPRSTVTFCMLARLLMDKGVVEFADAARIIRGRFPHARFELWGLLDDADVRCVKRATIAAWEAEGVLRFHGEARDAREAFAEADVVVLPSYYPEGLPRTLLEAASCGLPSITTDMPGCRDAVDPGVTGLLCQPRSAQSLADSMSEMLSLSAEQRAAMGRAGRARVLARFDERIVLSSYDRQIAVALGEASTATAPAAG